MTHILGNYPYEVLFRDFFNTDSLFDELTQCKYNYPVDIYENEKGITIEIAAVGLTDKDIEISVAADILRVKYEKTPGEVEKKRYVHSGISRRSFNMGWKIGAQFELNKLEAIMDKGLLQINIPYSEKVAPRKVTIKNK
jgi:HSP20 family protein